MINLLPNNDKQNIIASRMNVLLLRFAVIQIFAVMFLGFVFLIFYFVLNQIENSTVSLSGQNQNGLAANINKQYQTTVEKLNSANSQLSTGIAYYKTLIELGSLAPNGVILDSRQFNSAFYDNTIELKGKALNNDSVTQFTSNLASATSFCSEVSLKSSAPILDSNDDYTTEFVISLKIKKPGAN